MAGTDTPRDDDGDRTVFGRKLPEDDGGDSTIFGQKLPEAHPMARPQPVQTPLHQVRAPEPSDETTIIGARLPEPTPPAPKPLLPSQLKRKAREQPAKPVENKVSLRAAVRTSGRTLGKGSNPMLAAAGGILGLLGRLRKCLTTPPQGQRYRTYARRSSNVWAQREGNHIRFIIQSMFTNEFH